MINIRKMADTDVHAVAVVHKEAFPRQSESLEWISCNYKAYPRIQYFVAESQGQIVGYIEWLQKSGLRKEVILELEQMAVAPSFQGKGIGRSLIQKSLPLISQQVAERRASLKHVIVTTRADNHAQRLYASTLNATVEATISNLYSADEVVMIARNILVEDNNKIVPGPSDQLI